MDFSSKFISEIVINSFCQNVGKVFHLTNSEQAPRWSQFMEWLQQIGFHVENVSLDSWMEMCAFRFLIFPNCLTVQNHLQRGAFAAATQEADPGDDQVEHMQK